MTPINIPLSACVDSPFQDRLSYDQVELEELADSIAANELLQPAVGRLVGPDGVLCPVDQFTLESRTEVHKLIDGGAAVQIAAGHRRLRAFRILQDRDPAKWSFMPTILRPLTDEQMAVDVWEENHRRESLNPIEEALGIQRRIEHFEWTQQEAATRLGIDRSTVSNKLRLLKLPEVLHEEVARGALSERQAMALVPLFTLSESQTESIEWATENLAVPVTPQKLASNAVNEAWPSDRIREEVETYLTRTLRRYHALRMGEAEEPEPKRSTVEIKTPAGTASIETEKVEEYESGPSHDRQTVEVYEPVQTREPEDPLEDWPIPMPDLVYRDLDAMTKAELEEVNKRFRQHLWYHYDDGWRVSSKKSEQLDHVKRQVQFHANLEACMMLSAEQADELHAWIRERTDGWYGRTHGVWQGRHQSGSSAYFAMEAVRDAEKLGFMVDEPMRRFRQIITRIAGAFCYDLFLESLRGETGDSSESDPETADEAISDPEYDVEPGSDYEVVEEEPAPDARTAEDIRKELADLQSQMSSGYSKGTPAELQAQAKKHKELAKQLDRLSTEASNAGEVYLAAAIGDIRGMVAQRQQVLAQLLQKHQAKKAEKKEPHISPETAAHPEPADDTAEPEIANESVEQEAESAETEPVPTAEDLARKLTEATSWMDNVRPIRKATSKLRDHTIERVRAIQEEAGKLGEFDFDALDLEDRCEEVLESLRASFAEQHAMGV